MQKVLVIEDNADSLRLMEYALRRAGYEVIAAERGEEGVELAARERPSFIIMDVSLPGIDGIEAAGRIRNTAEGRNIPIIAVTAHAMKGTRERMIAADFDGYIEKPIDPLSIVDQIRRMLGGTGS